MSRRSHTVHLTRTVFVSAYVSECFVVVSLLLFSVAVVFFLSSFRLVFSFFVVALMYFFLRFSLLKRKIIYIQPCTLTLRTIEFAFCLYASIFFFFFCLFVAFVRYAFILDSFSYYYARTHRTNTDMHSKILHRYMRLHTNTLNRQR